MSLWMNLLQQDGWLSRPVRYGQQRLRRVHRGGSMTHKLGDWLTPVVRLLQPVS